VDPEHSHDQNGGCVLDSGIGLAIAAAWRRRLDHTVDVVGERLAPEAPA
jgi:hypothetical protein